MGQAELRGTFEQRKEEALTRNFEQGVPRREVSTRRPTLRLQHILLTGAAAIALMDTR